MYHAHQPKDLVDHSGRSAVGWDQPPEPFAAQQSVTATTDMNMKIRRFPGTQYSVVGEVPAGTTVPVIARVPDNSWVFIEYNGTTGWIAAWLTTITGDLDSVPMTAGADMPGSAPDVPPEAPPPDEAPPAEEPPADQPPPAGVTATSDSNLNIREGPGTDFAKVGTLTAGVPAPVQGRTSDNNWVFIVHEGTSGWVAAWLVTITGDLNSVPVTAEDTAPAPAPTPTQAPEQPAVLPTGSGGLELGGQTHTLEHPDEMRFAGMTWVKFQHKWAPDQPPTDVQARIEHAHAMGFKILLSIPGQDHPTSIDFEAYADFVGGVAALGADAIEVWNEQNIDREWPVGQIDPGSYVNNLLAPSYNKIKEANPGTMVISGAPAPTGFHNVVNAWSDDVYLAGMRDAGAANYMDCVGVHYNAGATSPDEVTGHPADPGPGHYSWYFPLMFNLYAGMFPNTDLCFTELGYLSPEGYGGLPANFWWGQDTSAWEQSQWLARAVEISQETGRVRLIIIFNVDFTHYGDDPQAGYAMIRPGGCLACDSLHNVMFE
jgi:uncharacterized protein YraI